jgi:nucleoside-diphosphate-sugar epimerase
MSLGTHWGGPLPRTNDWPGAAAAAWTSGSVVGQERPTVLVTGASGFLGRRLVAALAGAGHGVRAATRLPTEFPPGIERVLVPDFTHPIDWDPLLRGVRLVVHTAGLAHADSSEIPHDQFDRINRIATQELARAAWRAGVAHFVFISSVRAQIGASAPHVLHESDDPQPTDRYGRSKLDAELAVQAAGVPFTVIRPVVVYGPDAKANIRLLIRLASLPLPLPFAAFGNRRSILGVDNLVSAILFALGRAATIGETYLIADPAPVALRDIFGMLRRARGRRPGLIYVPPALFRLALTMFGHRSLWERIGDELVVDTSKFESLGWRPVLGTYDGLAAMLRFPVLEVAPHGASR